MPEPDHNLQPGDQFVPLLISSGCEMRVVEHCKKVRDVAVSIADRINKRGLVQVDRDLVAVGAILHDIGRGETHSLAHAVAGAAICRREGFSEDICLIVERHIGAGMTSNECVDLGLEPVDRLPLTYEEKIVAHADNLVKGTWVITIQTRIESARGLSDVVLKRIADLADEIEALC